MNNIIEKIKRIKVDSIYGKKKHFNAADRKQNIHYWIGIPLVLVNIVTGTSLFILLTENVESWLKFLPVIFAFIAAILGGLQTYFNFNEKVEGHRKCGNDYLAVLKKCDRLQATIKDKLISTDKVLENLEEIGDEINRINKVAESYPTSKKDYMQAQEGIKEGEETYLQDELDL
ncbi:SLATT domain-containing protein [Marinifilum sp. N1E240]|uniref:SLATT domain-containing protein n=1 Tax=Marinifilum sp. N1E240 TaxID=2608082 RepID=UPI00128D216F|nr:SLATT domain-containing protein [Marinifilum sp. N1E240]MPQ49097.1 SLATT domain-containing protein [Marinifilum sp. N1E240]